MSSENQPSLDSVGCGRVEARLILRRAAFSHKLDGLLARVAQACTGSAARRGALAAVLVLEPTIYYLLVTEQSLSVSCGRELP